MSEIVYICKILRKPNEKCEQSTTFENYSQCKKGRIEGICERYENYDDALQIIEDYKKQNIIFDTITVDKKNDINNTVDKYLDMRKVMYKNWL